MLKGFLIFDAICMGIVAICGIIRNIKFIKYYNILLKLFHYIEINLLFNYDGYYNNITTSSLGLIYMDKKDNTTKMSDTTFFVGAYYKYDKSGPSMLQKLYIFDREHKDKVFNKNDLIISEEKAKENALLCIQLKEKDNSIGIYTNKILDYTVDVLLSMNRYRILKNTVKIFFGPLKHKKDFICPITLNYGSYKDIIGINNDEHV